MLQRLVNLTVTTFSLSQPSVALVFLEKKVCRKAESLSVVYEIDWSSKVLRTKTAEDCYKKRTWGGALSVMVQNVMASCSFSRSAFEDVCLWYCAGLGSEAPAQENAASAPAPGSVDTSLTRASKYILY